MNMLATCSGRDYLNHKRDVLQTNIKEIKREIEIIDKLLVERDLYLLEREKEFDKQSINKGCEYAFFYMF